MSNELDPNDLLSIRQKFIEHLQKLSENSTRESSFTQLKSMIKNFTLPKHLRIYLNSLMTFQTNSMKSQEIIIILFGYISNIFRSNLLDPLDKPLSLIKTINRIITHLRNNCFKNNNYVIQKATSYTIIEILRLSMDKNDDENLNDIFIQPFLNDILFNSNIYIKNGCCIYLNDLIFNLKEKNNFTEKLFNLIVIKNKYIENFIAKIKIENFENEFLYESLYNLISFWNFKYFIDKYNLIIEKMILNLEINLNKNKNKNSNIKIKDNTIINCINVLNLLGQITHKNNFICKYVNKIIDINKSYMSNRNKFVRLNAQKCSKIWDEIEKEKFFKDEEHKIDFNKINLKNKMLKSAKTGKIEKFQQFDSEIVNMKKDVYNTGIENLINLSKFIKNHTKDKSKEKNVNNFNKENTLKKINHLNRYNDDEDLMPIKYEKKIFNSNNNKNYDANNNNVFNNYLPPPQITDFNQNENLYDINNNNNINNNFEEQKNNINSNNYNNNEINNINSELSTGIFLNMNIKTLLNSFNSIKHNILNSEKIINTKFYKLESKIETVQNKLKLNSENIYKSHNNILDDTLKTSISKTENYESTIVFDKKNYNNIFQTSLNLLNQNDFEGAFKNILGDDIYLIRLLMISQNYLNNLIENEDLSKKLFVKILFRINQINKTHFILILLFNLIEKNHIIIDNEIKNELLITFNELKQIKNNNIQNKIFNLIHNINNNY